MVVAATVSVEKKRFRIAGKVGVDYIISTSRKGAAHRAVEFGKGRRADMVVETAVEMVRKVRRLTSGAHNAAKKGESPNSYRPALVLPTTSLFTAESGSFPMSTEVTFCAARLFNSDFDSSE